MKVTHKSYFTLEVNSFEARLLKNLLAQQSYGSESQDMFDTLNAAIEEADNSNA